MSKDGYAAAAPLWGLGGLIVGAWVGSRFGYGRDGACGYGGYGGACGVPGYGAYAPAYGYAGYCNPGYGPYPDRPRHEDKQDERLACVEAKLAAVAMAEAKDMYWEQKMECAQNQIIDGKIYKATCHKPNGEVYLSPRHLANAYRGESRVLDSHRVGFDCRDGRGRDGFRNDCNDCGDNWY